LPAALLFAKEAIERLMSFAESVERQGEGALSGTFYIDKREVDAIMVCIALADAYNDAAQQSRAPTLVLQ
jgi:hypothetical protein